MTSCAHCGRENLAEARFCMACGKALATASEAATAAAMPQVAMPQVAMPQVAVPALAPTATMLAGVPAANGQQATSRPGRATAPGRGESWAPALECARCGQAVADPRTDRFCARCGAALAFAASSGDRAVLVSLGETMEVLAVHEVAGGEVLVGRGDVPLAFPEDPYLSPVHARLERHDGTLVVRDLGSRNGTWVFVDGPAQLADGDRLLVGSQVLRFRRLGYPGPHPAEADATRRMGSAVPGADVAVLEQLRADGSVRDVLHLSPGRSVVLGRETGDWLFPYDQTMSGRHAEVRSEGAEFFVDDLGSRNGVAMAVRGERELAAGQRVLLGDQMLRVEAP